ncbi:hypothetical protein [Streptomyces sp. Amel2xC10]|uniref:hypothetical protein n=1 Tax=Streptomyces sp. Amel2xC10 TaxID=1305826 RepID=UPI001180E539|nr:hypothetical protein [Streptomyces sp. Amel2xC10]
MTTPVGRLPPEARLVRFQSSIDKADWKLAFMGGDERARIEGFHPDGHAVMATAVRGRAVHAYVFADAGKKTRKWVATNPDALTYFLVHQQLPAGAARRRPYRKCRCGKRRYPTQALAKAALLDILTNKELRQGRRATETRAYRCPDDDRVWHLTSRKSWRHGTPAHRRREP